MNAYENNSGVPAQGYDPNTVPPTSQGNFIPPISEPQDHVPEERSSRDSGQGSYIPLTRQWQSSQGEIDPFYEPTEQERPYPEPFGMPPYSIPEQENRGMPFMQEPYGYGGIPPYAPPPKKKKSPKGRTVVALALCCSILGSILGGGGVLLVQRLMDRNREDKELVYLLEGRRENLQLQSETVDTSQEMTATQVYDANVRSTVGITTTATTTNFWGYRTTSAASGSGFFITGEGHILTNFHVIEGSDSITVTLYSGENYEAELLGYDESNDIAVLKIHSSNTLPVILGDSDALRVGDSVVAIGNPLGELTFSLTSGSVSAKDREVTFAGSVPMKLIQTDCAINSGNSGGALFNLYGEVIGVTNGKYSGNSSSASIDNIGFAIPINSIREIIRGIIEDGYIMKPYGGISLADLGFEAQFYGLPMGALVQGVDAQGPAAAVLQQGDIIIEANGNTISGAARLIHLIEASQSGDTLNLSVYRQGQVLQLSLTLTDHRRPAIPDSGNSYY